MNPKRLIQMAWVVEVAILILYGLIGIPFLPIERLEFFIRMLPLFTALIGGQGVIAFAGPEVKRYIESRNMGASARAEKQGNPLPGANPGTYSIPVSNPEGTG